MGGSTTNLDLCSPPFFFKTEELHKVADFECWFLVLVFFSLRQATEIRITTAMEFDEGFYLHSKMSIVQEVDLQLLAAIFPTTPQQYYRILWRSTALSFPLWTTKLPPLNSVVYRWWAWRFGVLVGIHAVEIRGLEMTMRTCRQVPAKTIDGGGGFGGSRVVPLFCGGNFSPFWGCRFWPFVCRFEPFVFFFLGGGGW